jgi:predicted transcriptional regulator
MAVEATIKVSAGVKGRLDALKIHPRETYNDVIERLTSMAIDPEPLTDDELRRLEEARKDRRDGRTYTHDQVLAELGLE